MNISLWKFYHRDITFKAFYIYMYNNKINNSMQGLFLNFRYVDDDTLNFWLNIYEIFVLKGLGLRPKFSTVTLLLK